MNKKEYTTVFLEQAGIPNTPENVAKYIKEWWVSPYSPVSLRLTHAGSSFLSKKLKITKYICKLNTDYVHTLRLILEMNKHFSSPFYFYESDGQKLLACYGETDATMIILMDGNLTQYLNNFSK